MCSKMNKGEHRRGGGVSKVDNLERTYFFNIPLSAIVSRF